MTVQELGDIGRAIETLRVGARIARDNDSRAAADRAARDRSQVAMDQLTREFATTISGVLAKLGQSADQVREAATDMTALMADGILQADGSRRPEPRMDVADVARAVVYMASLPLGANVAQMTVMATAMPFLGRG